MNAKLRLYGQLAALVIWPALASLSIWLVAGGMPAAIEKVYVAVLWGLAVFVFIGALGLGVVWMLGLRGERRASEPSALSPIFPVVVRPSRLVLIVALFLAGNSVLAGLFFFGFAGISGFASLIRRRAVVLID